MPRTWISAPAKGMGVGDTGVEFASKLRGVSFTNDGALMVLPGQSLIPTSAWTDFGLPIKAFSARAGDKNYVIIGVLEKSGGTDEHGHYYVRIYDIDGDSYTDVTPTTAGDFAVYNIPVFNPYSLSTVPYAFIGAWSSDGSLKSKKVKLGSSITTLNLGIEAPTQAPSAAAGDAGSLDGTYYFRYTYYDSSLDIESNGSPASDAVTVANQNVDLSNIAGTGQPGVDKIRIYGLGGSVTEYMLIATIDNPGAGQTTSYTVSTAESEWGQNIPTDHDPPPSDIVYLEWNEQLGRLFAVDDDGRLWWSSSWQPDYWPTDNYIDTGLELLALATFRGTTYVFTKDEAYQVVGPINDQFEIRKVADIGVIGPAALAVIPTGIMMVTPAKSVILFVGGLAKSIGEPIEGILRAEKPLDNYYGYNFWTVSTAGNRGFVTFGEVEREVATVQYVAVGVENAPEFHILKSDGANLSFLTKVSNGSLDEVRFSPNGNYIAAVKGEEAALFVYEFDGSTLSLAGSATLPGDVGGYGVAWSPNGSYIAVAHGESPYFSVYSWDGSNLTLVDTYTLTNTGQSCSFNKDGSKIAVVSGAVGTIWLLGFDGSNLALLDTVSLGSSNIHCHFSPVEDYLVVSNGDGKVAVYDCSTDSFSLIDTYTLSGEVCQARFSPCGKYIAVGTRGASILYLFKWDGSSISLVTTYSTTARIRSIGWGPTREQLVACEEYPAGNTLYYFQFDGSNLTLLDTYEHENGFYACDASPVGESNLNIRSLNTLVVHSDGQWSIDEHGYSAFCTDPRFRTLHIDDSFFYLSTSRAKKGLNAIAVKYDVGPYEYPLDLQSVYPDDTSPSPDSSNLIQSNRIFPAGPGRKFRLRGFKFKVHKVQGTPEVSITLKVDGGGTGKEYSKNNVSITTDYGALGTFYPTTNLIGHYLNYEVSISSNIAKFYGLEIEWEPIGGATEPVGGGGVE